MLPEEKQQLTDLVKTVTELNKTITKHIGRSENFDTAIKINVDNLVVAVGKLETLITDKYIRREEFTPVKNIAYGLVSVVVLSVMGALMSLIIRTKSSEAAAESLQREKPQMSSIAITTK